LLKSPFPPILNELRGMGNAGSDSAVYQVEQGQYLIGVNRLRSVLFIGRSLQQDTSLLSQLVGIGIDALACDAAQQVAPRLPRQALREDAALKRAVEALIQELLDERSTPVYRANGVDCE